MTAPTASRRHRWTRRDAYNATCTECGTHAQKRPSPYGRRWFTEWRLPDGTYTDNYDGGKTPPCIGPEVTA
ncbi:hypothetical protein [Planobispora takensis]|uniref:Uncharacterized protein n=1 Tax=Planobispora takensis TaxID=1367882 RepID=A0A8J3SWF9_9ACTN|nr:hypothetical protein [Planobispora takensis]GII01742.1 hypothetical protein Pta02_37500 [Planobispora takensis]